MVFTKDWFSNNVPRWKHHVIPFFESKIKEKEDNKILIIGCHEGRAPLWLLQNAIKGKNNTLYCIDVFSKYPAQVKKNFKNNLEEYKSQISVLDVQDFKEGIYLLKDLKFDFIFIDCPVAVVILECMVMSFPMLKPKGMMIIDDYTNSKEHLHNCPKAAVDPFMDIYAPYIKLIELSWQAVIIKRSRPLKQKKCQSEYYHEDMGTI